MNTEKLNKSYTFFKIEMDIQKSIIDNYIKDNYVNKYDMKVETIIELLYPKFLWECKQFQEKLDDMVKNYLYSALVNNFYECSVSEKNIINK